MKAGWLRHRVPPLMSDYGFPVRSRYAPMAVALAVWICTLPFVALLLAPWLGSTVAGWVALSFLVIIVGLCWGLCSAKSSDLRETARWRADKQMATRL